jgi:lipopolysaccharide export LptBFGC system permease protein LptF
MTHFCSFLGRSGHLPATVAAWLPNAVFLVAGVINFRRLT